MARSEPTTQTAASMASGSIVPARLVVIDGPDRGGEALLEKGSLVIGTQRGCELLLQDPTVSRQHTSVSLLPGRLKVSDLGSKNGTKYFGARITTLDVPLGAILEVGGNRIALLPAAPASGEVSELSELSGLHGQSLPMRRLYKIVERVAASDASVLIEGETGSGKERVAKAIHGLSSRAGAPFLAFDCASAPRDLLLSMLFGHVRGAFTGAVRDSTGALGRAHGGTLFLDEIGELSLDAQPALMRALDTGEYCPVGGTQVLRSSFRVLAATRLDLGEQANKGQFNQGLYYRLSALGVRVPPLRERSEDIPLLVRELLKESGQAPLKLEAATVAQLCGYQWPGNVRELGNFVSRAGRLGPNTAVEVEHPGESHDFHQARAQAVKAFERAFLVSLLEQHPASLAAAARAAGIARSYFYRLLREHGLTGAGAASDDGERD